ncbi:MAG: ornithine carbamoyltransferase [Anaerolineales bacterium]|nr:ornithine carbamoyltransferase [Anaerolineales bacterium]
MPRHYLHISDHTPESFQGLLDLALKLKAELRSGGNAPVLKGKILGMVFQKPSLRTRVSFDVAMRQLGGDALYLSPAEIGLGGRESVADVARVLSRYVSGIMARTFSHQHILDLAQYASVPVINGLSDYNHPCQGLADLLTVLEHKGRVKGLRIVYVGDGFNVATSLWHGCALLGANFVIASPRGYELGAKAVEIGQAPAAATGATIERLNDPRAAVAGADVIYTDTWTSMGQEAEAAIRRQAFDGFQVNAGLMALAKPDAIVLHCLPAHRNEEITDEVMDGPQSVVFDQAENRLHAQKAVLASLMA